MNALEIRDLHVDYGARPIFAGLDLAVAERETIAVLGASGSGKSTLLRAIAGLVKPMRGTIRPSGEIGYVFQEPRLFPWLTVERNVAFAARDADERARVAEVLELVGLTGARTQLPKALSGGMAQRVALARSLVRKPALLLLDEPLAALDALRRLELQRALRDLIAASGAAAILVTHDVDEALRLADRVLVLAGEPAAITFETSGAGSAQRIALLAALGVDVEAVEGVTNGPRYASSGERKRADARDAALLPAMRPKNA